MRDGAEDIVEEAEEIAEDAGGTEQALALRARQEPVRFPFDYGIAFTDPPLELCPI